MILKYILAIIILHLSKFGSAYCPQYPPSDQRPFLKAYEIDDRCPEIINEYLQCPKKVTSKSMVIEGYNIYLCDGPGVDKRDRPTFGTLNRKPISRYYKEVSVFLGIPYARPPTKDNGLRFQPPVPPTNSYVNATYYRPVCPQHDMYVDRQEVDEDCLYLNIFTQFPVPRPPTLYPVVVYIHGGSWDHGSPRTFPGHMLAASQDLVVVTVAYRLGPLGFLATPEAPGNYGLLDLAAALRWIQQNIAAFNGDPGRVTVMGSEAGAAAAGLLALSPLSSNLVHRVVALSGAAVAGWAAMKDPDLMKNASHALGEALGCSPGSRLLSCLASRSVHDLRRTRVKPRLGWLPFSPVVDNQTRALRDQFLPLAPQDLLDQMMPSSRFVFLSGVVANAAAELVETDTELRKFHEYQLDEAMFNRKVEEFMKQHNYTLNHQATLDTITFMYRPWWYGPQHLRQAYIDLLSDAYFKAPNDQMVKGLLQRGARVYMYVLNYTLEGVPWPTWLGPTLSSEVLLASGAPFMASHLYSARLELGYATWTEADRNVSQLFMEAFGNLAREGNPSPQQLFNTIRWEEMEANNLQYLGINGTRWEVGEMPASRMERDYRQREAELWQTYLPWVVARWPATWAPSLAPWAEAKPLFAASIWSTAVLAVIFSILGLAACCLFMVRRNSDSY